MLGKDEFAVSDAKVNNRIGNGNKINGILVITMTPRQNDLVVNYLEPSGTSGG